MFCKNVPFYLLYHKNHKKMPANLTQQYRKAEDNYRQASTPEEELKWLQIMFAEIPKHKGTENLQAKLKQKISATKADAEKQRTSSKKAAGRSFKIPRQGAGTAVVIGGPNAGKSQLLCTVSRATPEVAPYPFTTQEPKPGMMQYEDVFVQLIDTPPITPDYLEPYMYGFVRSADLVLLMVDLGDDGGVEQCQDVVNRLQETKTRLATTTYLDEEDVGLSFTRTFLVPNKIDLPDAPGRLELLHELCPLPFEEFVISTTENIGLDRLREAIYNVMDVVRVYTKTPSKKEADYDRPFTLKRGSTLLDLAELIHNDYAANLKFGKAWGSAVHDGTVVKGDYVLNDKDVIEIHV